MWMLWYFIPIIFLTLLVYYPPYTNYIKKVYHEDVFKELGWNTGIGQVITGARAAMATTVGAFGLIIADNYISDNVINPDAVDKAWANYNKDRIR